MEAAVDVFEERLDKMDTTDLEANPEETEAVVERQEIQNEEAAVGTFRALEDRYGDRHVAVGRTLQQKKRTQGNGKFRKKLAAVRR
jgi:hypothetical protein